ncbi:MAG: HupE/UreJ family protein [Planctomycetota bacterium]
MRALLFLLVLACASALSLAHAHETRPGYLELLQESPETYRVLWKVPARGDLRLALDLVFPEDCRIEGEPMRLRTAEAFVEKLVLTRSGGLDGVRLSIDGLVATQTDVLVRVVRLDGAVQMERLTPARTAFEIVAHPGPWQAALAHVRVGVEHILLGADHLLFVLGLMLLVRGRRALVGTISAFTLAHSLTLALATLGVAAPPLPPLNAAIALSILFLGPEIVRAWRGETSLTLRRPWLVAFLFGLLHGFGFASGLASTDLARGELVRALLWFNLGVEAGQLAFVGLLLALTRSFARLELVWPTWVARAPGYAIGACGAFWTIERTLALLAA